MGNQIGVGKESDVYVGGDPELNVRERLYQTKEGRPFSGPCTEVPSSGSHFVPQAEREARLPQEEALLLLALLVSHRGAEGIFVPEVSLRAQLPGAETARRMPAYRRHGASRW